MTICREYTARYNRRNKTSETFNHEFLPILGIENNQVIYRCKLCQEMYQRTVIKGYTKGPHHKNIQETEGNAYQAMLSLQN